MCMQISDTNERELTNDANSTSNDVRQIGRKEVGGHSTNPNATPGLGTILGDKTANFGTKLAPAGLPNSGKTPNSGIHYLSANAI